jgi:hypothetical protein
MIPMEMPAPQVTELLKKLRRGWGLEYNAAINLGSGNVIWGNEQPTGRAVQLGEKKRTLSPYDMSILAAHMVGPWVGKRFEVSRPVCEFDNRWVADGDWNHVQGITDLEVAELCVQQRHNWIDPKFYLRRVMSTVPAEDASVVGNLRQRIAELEDRVSNQMKSLSEANNYRQLTTEKLNTVGSMLSQALTVLATQP